MLATKMESRRNQQTEQVSELCRQKLLGYAEGFWALAKSFDDGFEGSSSDRQSRLEERRHWENKKVVYDNLKEVAHIMERVAKEEFRYRPMENRYIKIIRKVLREEGLEAENLCYLSDENGQQEVVMTLRTMGRECRPAEEVADMLSALLHKPLQVSAVSPYLVDRESRSYLFVEEADYIVLTGFAKAVRENENVSGDNYAFLEAEKNKMTILLSDGTGSGEKAGRDSGQVLDLMEKMLETGYGIPSAVKLVNSALYAKGDDMNHPTIDVCHLDLYHGKCDFYKVGGALSFLKRGNQAETIEVGSLPLGIFRSIEPEKLTRQLQDGDYLIMMSDGVPDAFGEDGEELLRNAICSLTEQNPGEMAEALLHMAILSCEGHIADDMTILVAGIWENSSII